MALLGINFLVYLLQDSMPYSLYSALPLWPIGTPEAVMTPYGLRALGDFHIWQLVTYGFLHANFTPIFFNMFGVWMFGTALEQVLGPRRFLFYFFVSVIGAGIIQLITAALTGGLQPTVGASGGVFGILLAFGMLFPNRPVFLIFFPVPIPAKYMVIGYGALELWAGVAGTAPGIANFAHLGGMLSGFLLLKYWINTGVLTRNRGPFFR